MRCLTRIVALLVAAALVSSSWTRDVQAAPVRTERAARGHYTEGERLFAAGRYEQALAEFQAGYVALPLPGFLIDIGQCHRKLGDAAGARQAYESFLAKAPDSPLAPQVRRYIHELTAPPGDEAAAPIEAAADAAGSAPAGSLPAGSPPAGSPPAAPDSALPRAPEVPKNPLAAAPVALIGAAAPTPASEPSSLPAGTSKVWWVVAAVSILGLATAIGIGATATSTSTSTIHDGTLGTLRR